MTSSPVAFTANAHDLYAEIILDALDLEDMCVCVCVILRYHSLSGHHSIEGNKITVCPLLATKFAPIYMPVGTRNQAFII